MPSGGEITIPPRGLDNLIGRVSDRHESNASLGDIGLGVESADRMWAVFGGKGDH